MRCTKCGADVAEGQLLCPQCDTPVAPNRRAWLWVAVVVLLVVFAGALGYRIYLLKTPAPAPASSPKVSLEIPPAPATPPPTPEPAAVPPSRAERPDAAYTSPAKPKPATSEIARVETPTPPPPEPKPAEPPPPAPEPPAQETPPKATRPRPRGEIFRPDPDEVRAPARPAESRSEPAPAAAYNGPSAGTLIWTGQIEKDTLVTINGDQASLGRLTGELPGVPVRIQIENDTFAIVEAPSTANRWKRLSLRSLKRVRGGVVIKWGVLDANR